MSSIEDGVKALIPQMTQQVADAIREEAMKNIKWSTAQAITAEVTKYIAEIVLPLVRADLEAASDDIRAAIVAAAKGVAVMLAEQLVVSATKKIASYEGDKLLTSVFGPLFRGY